MDMEKKFLEKATVVRVELNPYISGEGSVLLRVENKDISPPLFLDCFIAHWAGSKSFKLDETAFVELRLKNAAWKNKRPEKNEKQIKYIKITPVAVNRYALTGGILDFFESEFEDSYDAVIDCGIYAKIRILKEQNFKIGDYIQSEGRLDAIKVGIDEKQGINEGKESDGGEK